MHISFHSVPFITDRRIEQTFQNEKFLCRITICKPTNERANKQINRRVICCLTNVNAKCFQRTEKNQCNVRARQKHPKSYRAQLHARDMRNVYLSFCFCFCCFFFRYLSALCVLTLFQVGNIKEVQHTSLVSHPRTVCWICIHSCCCCCHFHNSSFTCLNPVAHQNHNHCVNVNRLSTIWCY